MSLAPPFCLFESGSCEETNGFNSTKGEAQGDTPPHPPPHTHLAPPCAFPLVHASINHAHRWLPAALGRAPAPPSGRRKIVWFQKRKVTSRLKSSRSIFPFIPDRGGECFQYSLEVAVELTFFFWFNWHISSRRRSWSVFGQTWFCMNSTRSKDLEVRRCDPPPSVLDPSVFELYCLLIVDKYFEFHFIFTSAAKFIII